MPSYRTPPLVEIYSELVLRPGQLQQRHFFQVGPRLTTIGLSEIEFQTVPQGVSVTTPSMGAPQMTISETTRVRCWHPDRTKLVQFSPDLIVVNLLQPYAGWGAFTELFGSAIACFRDVLGGQPHVQTLSLLTSDRMTLPRRGFSIGRYLNAGGAVVPSLYREVSSAADILIGHGLVDIDGQNRSVRIQVRAEGNEHMIIAIQSAFRRRLDPNGDLSRELETLHELSNTTFEALVTDTTRTEVMGGLR